MFFSSPTLSPDILNGMVEKLLFGCIELRINMSQLLFPTMLLHSASRPIQVTRNEKNLKDESSGMHPKLLGAFPFIYCTKCLV